MRTLAIVLSFVLLPTFGWAANCGVGVKPCVCGDRVTTEWTLPANLTCTNLSLDGLQVAAGANLDLNGFRLLGPVGTIRTGVLVLGPDAIVKNGIVRQWRRGVRLNANATRARGINLTSRNNTLYNFELNGVDQKLTGITSITPGDEHFHVSHATGFELDNCVASGPANEIVYVLDSQGEYTCVGPVGQTLIYSDHTDPVSGNEYITQCKLHISGGFQCDTETRP